MAEQTIELTPGESKLVSFEAVPHEARTYQVSVNGLTGSFITIPKIGFSLRITNPPTGTYWWIADFWYSSFDWDPPAGSGGLLVNQPWVFDQDPRGCMTLHISVFDINKNRLQEVFDLGPIENGKSYVYDWATGSLT